MFSCLLALPDGEFFCECLKGIWYNGTDSCYKKYDSTATHWNSSYTECRDEADKSTFLRGHLAHIYSSAVVDLVKNEVY